jgi:hypothetical protein
VRVERLGEDALAAIEELQTTANRTCELEINFCAAA